MAWCLMAPSHYVNQWVDLSSKVFWDCSIHLRAISQDWVLINLIHNLFREYTLKITATSPWGQWVKDTEQVLGYCLSYFLIRCICCLLHFMIIRNWWHVYIGITSKIIKHHFLKNELHISLNIGWKKEGVNHTFNRPCLIWFVWQHKVTLRAGFVMKQFWDMRLFIIIWQPVVQHVMTKLTLWQLLVFSAQYISRIMYRGLIQYKDVI